MGWTAGATISPCIFGDGDRPRHIDCIVGQADDHAGGLDFGVSNFTAHKHTGPTRCDPTASAASMAWVEGLPHRTTCRTGGRTGLHTTSPGSVKGREAWWLAVRRGRAPQEACAQGRFSALQVMWRAPMRARTLGRPEQEDSQASALAGPTFSYFPRTPIRVSLAVYT